MPLRRARCSPLAADATAAYVRALTDYYASIGRPLPDLSEQVGGGVGE